MIKDGGAVAGDSEARSPHSSHNSLGSQQLRVATKPIIASIIGRDTTENKLSAQLGLLSLDPRKQVSYVRLKIRDAVWSKALMSVGRRR